MQNQENQVLKEPLPDSNMVTVTAIMPSMEVTCSAETYEVACAKAFTLAEIAKRIINEVFNPGVPN